MARRSTFRGWLVAAAVVLGAPSAFALVTEPNGLVVPLDSNNGEVQLYSFFQSQSEPIDWQNDAHTTPDVFSPLCSFSATFLLHQAGADVSLGWYNVDPNATQPPSQINIIIPAGTAVGTKITSSQIIGDPNYAGGLIGFAIVGMQTHYSEQKWNPVCSGCSSPGAWATALMYKSVNVPDSYYVAFEDGSVDASSFNNDGDFNDDVFLVSGLVCAGGGQPCNTGAQGVCGQGLTECDQSGTTNCKQVNQPQPEKCDALDNDCNGQIDDGDLCPTGQICDHGKCVAKCQNGEFDCTNGKTCVNGYCVETACATVTCDAGKVCVGGQCKGACDGVICPDPQQCQLGVCVDLCAGVSCPSGQVCDKGVCVIGCSCSACSSGLTCDPSTEKCTDPSCVGKSCSAGETCQGGNCVPACTGAVCPAGQVCQAGQCVDAATDGGTAGSGGGISFEGGLGGGGAKTGSGGAGAKTGGTTPANDSGGCGCRAASSRSDLGALAFGLGLLAFALGRRRR